jgi:pimeloyl-ACP methyl ester carboxylesterase
VTAPDPSAFPTRRATVRDGVDLAYVREGAGGYPLLLVHGWPETKRIWWRNIAPLAGAGFEVIVPDLRGFGETGPQADDRYDTAASSLDLHALVTEVLGHERIAASGGDYGGVIIEDMGLRFPGLIERQVLFNTIPPLLDRDRPELSALTRQAADYFRRQSRDADALAAELRSDDERRRYIGQFYGPRFWAAPGTFTREDVDFMTEPFADAATLRASFGLYESAVGNRPLTDVPRIFEPNPIPTVVLYGPDDHVIPADFPDRMVEAFPEIVGPYVVPGAGHFLQWEAARVLNGTMAYFLRDLLR